MNYTQEQIIESAKKILEKSGFGFDDEKSFTASYNPVPGERAFDIRTENTWLVSFGWGKEEFGKSRSALLYIDDKTGKPLVLVHSSGISKIHFEVKENGDIVSDTGMKFRI